MTSEAVAAAVVEWAAATIPELAGTYDHPDPERRYPLPDVMAAVTAVRVVDAAPGGLPSTVQQALAKVRDLRVIFAVDPTNADSASALVESICDRCTTAILADKTLGRRVPAVSPLVSWSFEPPFLEFDDGTKARQTTLTLTVVEPVPVRSPIPA